MRRWINHLGVINLVLMLFQPKCYQFFFFFPFLNRVVYIQKVLCCSIRMQKFIALLLHFTNPLYIGAKLLVNVEIEVSRYNSVTLVEPASFYTVEYFHLKVLATLCYIWKPWSPSTIVITEHFTRELSIPFMEPLLSNDQSRNAIGQVAFVH